MGSQAQTLANLQEYARIIKETDYDVDTHGDQRAYEARLNKTLVHLQDQVRQEQSTLQTVRLVNRKRVSGLLIANQEIKSYGPGLKFSPLMNHPIIRLLGFVNCESLLRPINLLLLLSQFSHPQARLCPLFLPFAILSI
jgi:hypothetical protein